MENNITYNQNELTQIKDTFTKLKDVCKTNIMQRKNQLSKDNSIKFYKEMYEYAVLWNSSLFCFIMFMLIIVPYEKLKDPYCFGTNFNQEMTTEKWFKEKYRNFSQKNFKTLPIQDKTMVKIPLVLITSSSSDTSSSLDNLFKQVMMNSFRNTDSNHQFADLGKAIEHIAANKTIFNSELNWDKLSNSNKKFLAHLSGKATNEFRFYHTNVKNRKKWIECVENEKTGLEFRTKMVSYLHPIWKAVTFYGVPNSKYPGLALSPISMIKEHLSITGDSISLAELVKKLDYNTELIVPEVLQELNRLRIRYDIDDNPIRTNIQGINLVEYMINDLFNTNSKKQEIRRKLRNAQMLNNNITEVLNEKNPVFFKEMLKSHNINNKDTNKIVRWCVSHHRNTYARNAETTAKKKSAEREAEEKRRINRIEERDKQNIKQKLSNIQKCPSSRQTRCSYPGCTYDFSNTFVNKAASGVTTFFTKGTETTTKSRSHCRICCNAFCPEHILNKKYVILSSGHEKTIKLCHNCENYAIHLKLLEKVHEGGKKSSKKPVKKVRKHQGIYQRGPKKGRLKPGFKYSGKKTKTGLKVIIKVKK